MKLIAAPVIGFGLAFVGLFGLAAIFHALTEPNYAPCATEADAGSYFANSGQIRKNSAGQYLCPVTSYRK